MAFSRTGITAKYRLILDFKERPFVLTWRLQVI